MVHHTSSPICPGACANVAALPTAASELLLSCRQNGVCHGVCGVLQRAVTGQRCKEAGPKKSNLRRESIIYFRLLGCVTLRGVRISERSPTKPKLRSDQSRTPTATGNLAAVILTSPSSHLSLSIYIASITTPCHHKSTPPRPPYHQIVSP